MIIKNIIWDWNGTIVDDSWVFVDVMNDLLKKKGLPKTTLAHYRKNFCFPIENYWRGLGFVFTKKEFNFLNASFIEEYQKKMFLPSLHSGLIALFKKANSYNVSQFILSASEHSLLKRSIQHYKLNDLFKAVYGVDNLNAEGKELLGLSLLRQHQLVASETILIGDTEYDYRVAKELGCRAVLISHGHIDHKRLLGCGVPVVSSVAALAHYLNFNQ